MSESMMGGGVLPDTLDRNLGTPKGFPPPNVVNLSKRNLTVAEYELLSLGLSFIPSPSPAKCCHHSLVEDFNSLNDSYLTSYTRTASSSSRSFLDRVCNRVRKGLANFTICNISDNLTPPLRSALRALRDDRSIIICKADKGDVTVVMDVEHYTEMAWSHLSDETTYCPLRDDPTSQIAIAFNDYLARCLDDGVIDKGTLEKLALPSHVDTQTLYFLPKVHKIPLKIRPIVSCTNGPTHTASSYIDALLQPYMRSVPSFVLNSLEIINTLADNSYPPFTYLATLDVESLYTNITHERAISTFSRLFRDRPNFVFLLDLLKYVLHNNVFSFDGTMYRQVCGLAMGTKLAPALATLVMAEVEEQFLTEQALKPSLWRRYIDDILLLWPHTKIDFQTFFSRLNDHTPKIKFTCNFSSTSVDFLDLTIYKNNNFSTTGKLRTSIYYKPTNTFTYSHATSYWHPNTLKSIALGECIRALRNTDNEKAYIKRKRALVQRLEARGYGPSTIRPLLALTFDRRDALISLLTKKRVDRPLPLRTRFFYFNGHVNHLFKQCWKDIADDPVLPYLVPTPPFCAFSNHKTLGKWFSHKRKKFASRCPDIKTRAEFSLLKFNRPRPGRVLRQLRGIEHTTDNHSQSSNTLRPTDHTCTNKRCLVCPRLTHTKYLASKHTGKHFPLRQKLTCQTKGVVYVLACELCGKQYVGQTSSTLRHRFAQHKYNFTRAPMSLYSHFLRFHRIKSLDVKIIIVESVPGPDERLRREEWWINHLSTVIPHGLNNPTTSSHT